MSRLPENASESRRAESALLPATVPAITTEGIVMGLARLPLGRRVRLGGAAARLLVAVGLEVRLLFGQTDHILLPVRYMVPRPPQQSAD